MPGYILHKNQTYSLHLLYWGVYQRCNTRRNMCTHGVQEVTRPWQSFGSNWQIDCTWFSVFHMINDVTDEFINTVAPILDGTMGDVVTSYAINLWYAKQVQYQKFVQKLIANIIRTDKHIVYGLACLSLPISYLNLYFRKTQ